MVYLQGTQTILAEAQTQRLDIFHSRISCETLWSLLPEVFWGL